MLNFRRAFHPLTWSSLIFILGFVSWFGAKNVFTEPLLRNTEALSRSMQENSCKADLLAFKNSGDERTCSRQVPSDILFPSNSERGPPLHLFFRVAVSEKSWSGAGRFLGWSKVDIALTTAHSLRVAIDNLGSAVTPPSLVHLTILYDGLQTDELALGAWMEVMKIVFSEFDGAGAGIGREGRPKVSLHHVAVEPQDTGNRGTNLLQFSLFRELPCASAPEGSGLEKDPIVYFVEDDYVHAPSALAELVDALTLTAIDGSNPPEYVMLYDHPDRSTFGVSDVGYGKTTVYGFTRHHWRTVPSCTMTFASRCSTVASALPLMEALAPRDQEIWHTLLWWTIAGIPLVERSARLVAPIPSLAIHATDKHFSFFGPPWHLWKGDSGDSGGLSFTTWCGLSTCLKDSILNLLKVRARESLALLKGGST